MKKAMSMAVLFTSLFLGGCSSFWTEQLGADPAKEAAAVSAGGAGYEITEMDYRTEALEAVPINLSGEGSGNGYERTEDGIVILSPGEYVLSGILEKGSVTVSLYEDETVHLILDGAEIRADGKPAVCIESADKAVITAKEGTENILSDSAHREEGADACLFSEADLTINGSGKLAVFGFHEHGIRSRDVAKVVGGSVYVKAKGDGIRGNNGVILYGSDVEVECEGNGIRAEDTRDMVILEGGICKVIAGKYAIKADHYVAANDCAADLYAVLGEVDCSGTVLMGEEGAPEAETAGEG